MLNYLTRSVRRRAAAFKSASRQEIKHWRDARLSVLM
jgi:hypothetical protein